MNYKCLKKWSLWLLATAFFLVLLTIGLIWWCSARIDRVAAPYSYQDIDSIPHNKAGLVLGASRYLPDGRLNLYFKYRIAAAAQLYHAGKIEHIIVSGDNHVAHYNEPAAMRDALIEKGVPIGRIHLDYAGFRTLDSVLRCREIFGQTRFTIISQDFHNRRAIFIAQHYDIQAVAFAARNLTSAAGRKTRYREKLARVKVFLDLYIFDTQPRFLGPKVDLPI